MLLPAELHAETQREDLMGKKSHNVSLFMAGTCTHGDERYSPPRHLPLPHSLLLPPSQPRERCSQLRAARLSTEAPGTVKEKLREGGRQLLF